MITLTDGNKTVVLTKREMELIEDGLRELSPDMVNAPTNFYTIRQIFAKLEGLKYE